MLSLVSIMSNEGGRLKGQPHFTAYTVLLKKAPKDDREAYASRTVDVLKIIGSPDFELDEEATKARARIAFDRGISPAGAGRQLIGVLASPNRTAGLRKLRLPTTVIHGKKDRLVNKSGGRAVAKAVPGAELIEIDGMGHDLPPAVWPQIVDAIADTAARSRSDSRYCVAAITTSTITINSSSPPPAASGFWLRQNSGFA